MPNYNIMTQHYSTKALTSAQYWISRVQQDNGETTTNPHIIAARLIKLHKENNLIIGATEINSILEHIGFTVTQSELDNLINLPYTEYTFPNDKDLIMSLYRTRTPANNRKWGIYMYINNVTGNVYVGSSVALNTRLRHYWKSWTKPNLRPILADIRKYGLNNFSLRIYDLPVDLQQLRLLIALEQFYIITMNPQNNALLVANISPGGEHLAQSNSDAQSTPTYMYYGDSLLYIFKSSTGKYNSVMSVLKVSSTVVTKSLQTGFALFWAYTLFKERLNDTDTPEFTTIEEVEAHAVQVRALYAVQSAKAFGERAKENNVSTPAIKITNVNDGTWVKCNNIWQAREWTRINVGKTMTTDTVWRRIKSGQPLNGYRYELYSD